MLLSCPPPETLVGFLLGKLPDTEAETIAAHLEECTRCEKTASSLEAISDSFLVELKRPTGDAEVLREQNFRRAAELVAAIGVEPTAAGVDRRQAASETPLGTLGQYRLLEKIGSGGMGTVYKALHVRLEKVVAVKVLPADRLQDVAAIARFDREMKAVGRLDHPHIVRATDAGDADGTHYLVMEYVAGIDLSTLARRLGALPITEACELVRQAAVGLQHAHENGLVHRDIKPGNLMLAHGGTGSGERGVGEGSQISRGNVSSPIPLVKILDLGLALLSDSHHASPQRELTSTGQMMGTLDYMAPEQGNDSHVVDIRADIYSLGATLYRLLTGEPIYSSAKLQTPVQKMMALATQAAPPIQSRRGDVPDGLAAVVARMLQRDPARRFATPSEVAAALAPFAMGADLTALAERAAIAEEAKDTISSASHARSGSTIVPLATPPRRQTERTSERGGWFVPTAVAGIVAVASLAALAAIFLLQTPQGTVSVEIDPQHGREVAVVVRGPGEEITLSDTSGWEVKLREGTYEVAMRGSDDRLKLDKNSITIRRGENQVVRVTLKPPATIVDVPAEISPVAVTRKASSDAIAWLVKHNALGPESDLVNDARTKIADYADRGIGFEYRLAGPLLASGKPTILAVQGPSMFVHELTAREAEVMKLNETPIAAFRSGAEHVGRRAAQPEFRLTALRLDHPATLGSDGQIAGWVDYQRLRPGEPKTHYYFRVVTLVDKTITTAQGIAGDLADDKGSVRLEINSPLPQDWPTAGTTMFVELGRFDRPDDFDQFVALSDPISTVIVLHPPPSP